MTWRGYDGSDWEIFLYDGASVIQLTDNSYDEAVAGINDRGDVVWVGSDDSDDEIFLYDDTSTTQLSNNTYDDMFPKLNNSGQVAWQGSVSHYMKYVFLYDGNVTFQLPDSSHGVFPHLNNQGKVVFGKSAGGGPLIECFDFFLYDESQTRQLERFEEDYDPHVNNIGQVVWRGFDLLGLDDEIFCYNGAHATQLTFNSYEDGEPQINDLGKILWTATMGDGTTEIFLAEPEGSLCSGTTAASTLEADRVYGSSDLGKHMVYLLLPTWGGDRPDGLA